MEPTVVKRRIPPTLEEEIEKSSNNGEKEYGVAFSSSRIRFFSWEILHIVLIHATAGIFFGYNIGLIGPYYTFVGIALDCTLITAADVCPNFAPGECVWHKGTCVFVENACEGLLHAECSAGVTEKQNKCRWNTRNGVCEPAVGYSALQNGIFAAGLTVGGCLGSFCVWFFLSERGQKGTFLIAGYLACLAAVITHISTYTDQYGLVVIGRVIAGVASGIVCVVSPMHVEETTPPSHRQVVGVFFQVACTVGILLAAYMGSVLNPQDFSIDVHMQKRRQGLCIPNTVFSVLLFIVALRMRESPVWMEQKQFQRAIRGESHGVISPFRGTADDKADIDDGAESIREPEIARHSLSSLIRPFFTSSVMCIAQQLTGINAIMNYAPTVTGALNFDPLSGNLIVMTWNFAAVLASIPFSLRYRADYMYIMGLFIASGSSVLTGVSLLPSFSPSTFAKAALSYIGIALFIFFFEVGMGSFFWILSQGIFPPALRAQGSSFTIFLQFLLNIMINVGFPVIVEYLSGGPWETQERGLGITFICFGCVGFLSAAYLLKYLRLWNSAK